METIQFIGTSPQQLRNLINEDVRTQLEELKKDFRPKAPTELLTRKETAQLLRTNFSGQYNWTRQGRLKAYGVWLKLHQKQSELLNALNR
ncbi:MAG: DNA-binding protein [Bacteroidota bacterium]